MAALIAIVVGLILILASVSVLVDRPVGQAFAREIGALLLVSASITLLWDLLGKRALLDEVLAKAQLSQDTKLAGIVGVTPNFRSGDLHWDSYFRDVSQLDIFFAYGRTWRNTHLEKLRKVARNKKARVRVVLPDPSDDQTVRELARRFSYDPDELVRLVEESEAAFKDLRQPGGASIEVWFISAAPTFSFYILDRIAILALFSHRSDRQAVPAFVCEQEGYLYAYLREEFDAMLHDGLARPSNERGV